MQNVQPAEAERGQQPIQPLTRRNASGAVYQRDPDVQRQIAAALELSPTALIERTSIDTSNDPNYLKEEAVVYLLRAYRQMGREDIVSDLTDVLVRRSAPNMNKWFRALDLHTREDASQEVWQQLFDQVFNFSNDRGDFFQVRFWARLHRLAIRVFEKYDRVREQTKDDVSIEHLAGSSDDAADEKNREVAAWTEILEPEVTPEQRAIYREGLGVVPEPQRTAFMLRYYYGWQIEDQDPAILTISRYFNKTDRTIRNWLKQAEAQLKQWRGAHE